MGSFGQLVRRLVGADAKVGWQPLQSYDVTVVFEGTELHGGPLHCQRAPFKSSKGVEVCPHRMTASAKYCSSGDKVGCQVKDGNLYGYTRGHKC